MRGSCVGRSSAFTAAAFKAETLSAETIQSFRDSTIGNAYATRLISDGTSTGFLYPQPKYGRWDLGNIFMQFDSDGDGHLTMGEFQRAFRALGMKKRSGEKLEMDQTMFNGFDRNKDGLVTIEEFEAGLPDEVRAKIEEKLDGGWRFDPKRWSDSIARHQRWDLAKVFRKFELRR